MKFGILIFLVIFSFGNTYSQDKDSLNVQPSQFVSSTVIHFELANSSIVSLAVYDRFGVVVRNYYQSSTLLNGFYNEMFFADTLVDDMYFVNLQIDQKPIITQKIIKNSTLGLSENSPKIIDLTISPNPFSSQITIPIEGSKKIEIKDLAGKIVHSIVTEETIISVSKLPKGEYLISIYSKDNQLITSQKIVKID